MDKEKVTHTLTLTKFEINPAKEEILLILRVEMCWGCTVRIPGVSIHNSQEGTLMSAKLA